MTQTSPPPALRPVSAAHGATDDVVQLLTFLLGSDAYALDIRQVREIIQPCPMTAVPMMPQFVRGVINLRGAVVPVIDLQARFGRPLAAIGKKTCIVIYDCSTATERIELGLLVDAVSEVVDVAGAAIEPPPSFGAALRREFIRGIAKLDSRFAIVLDPTRAFDIEELSALCDQSAGAGSH